MSEASAFAIPHSPSYRLVALIVASALFMEQLDGTVLATALPTMARDFGVDPLRMSLALTSYLLGLAVFIPTSGRIADRFGARNVFRAAIIIFTVGSVLCGRAETLGFLVAFRLMQGIGGAMMVPVGRLLLLRSVPRDKMVSAMAWLLVPATMGPLLGPPVGGFIVTNLSWRWIFDINVPIGLLGLALATLFIPDVREEGSNTLDLRGSVISGAALSCLVLGLEMTGRGLDARVGIGLLVAAVPLLVLYWFHARHHPDPVIDLGLLRVPSFAISVASGSLYRVAMGAQPFLLPLMLQIGFGVSAATSGAITFVGAAGAMGMRAVAPRALRRWGFRNVLIINGVIAVLLFAVEALFRPNWPMPLIYLALLLGGFSAAMQFTAYNTVAFADIPPAKMSAATSFYATCQQVCLTLGIIAAASSLAASRYFSGHSKLSLGDFSVAFVLVSVVGLLAPLISLRFAPDAGHELSGRQASNAANPNRHHGPIPTPSRRQQPR